MIVLEVSLNGKVLVKAGAEDLSVLMAEVQCIGKLGKESHLKGPPGSPEFDLFLGASGLTSRSKGEDVHKSWLSQMALKVGDKIKIKIIESSKSDKHIEERLAEDDSA